MICPRDEDEEGNDDDDDDAWHIRSHATQR